LRDLTTNTVVRAVLLPSVMTLLGERNWYLPRWLDRLLTRSEVLAPEPGLGRDPHAAPS
jgi:RND superfamily putative drug exporter